MWIRDALALSWCTLVLTIFQAWSGLVHVFFECYNSIHWFSRNSEDGVSVGMFFMSNGGGIMEKVGLGDDLWWFWEFEKFVVYNA